MAITTTTTSPAFELPSPPIIPELYGLSSVLDLSMSGQVRWDYGEGTWVPIYSGQITSGSTLIVCEGETTEVVAIEQPASNVVAKPFVIQSQYKCSSFGLTDEEIRQRTLQRLESVEPLALGARLAQMIENSPEVTFDQTPADAQEVAGRLQDLILQVTGGLGVLHMNHQVHSMIDPSFFEYRGGRAYTRTGTPVVISAAYDALGMFVTPQLAGYRGEIQHDGPHLNRATNDLTAVASRPWLIGVDVARVFKVSSETLGVLLSKGVDGPEPEDPPTDPVDPDEPVETPTDPVEPPTDPSEPTEPTDPVDPPADTTDPADPVDPPAEQPDDHPADPVDPPTDPAPEPNGTEDGPTDNLPG